MQILYPVYYVLRSLLLRGPLANIRMWRAEQTGDEKLNIHTAGFIKSRSSSYYHYQGASYYVLERIFRELKELTDVRNFTDIGCGMGRVLFVGAQHGFSPLTGIELNGDLVAKANENLSSFEGGKDIQFLHKNALNHIFRNERSVYFFFNPFDETVLGRVLGKIIHENHQELWFVYMNPIHAGAFGKLNIPEIKRLKTGFYTEAVIYRLRPERR